MTIQMRRSPHTRVVKKPVGTEISTLFDIKPTYHSCAPHLLYPSRFREQDSLIVSVLRITSYLVRPEPS